MGDHPEPIFDHGVVHHPCNLGGVHRDVEDALERVVANAGVPAARAGLRSASGRLRWLSKMFVRTYPGQSTDTPTPASDMSSSLRSVSLIATTADLLAL